MASQMPLVLKNHLPMQETIRDTGSIHGLGRSSGGGHGNPFQYSCLENPHGQRSLAAYVHKVAKNQTQLKQHMHIYKTDKQIPTAQHREL